MRREALLYARLPFALLSYLQAPRNADPAGEIRRQLELRASGFLDTLRRTVFADPVHPYHLLFQAAGCTFDDLAASVQRDGLETALETLRREGVFLTHDEFKGRAPVVRSGRHIPANGSSWNNPLVSGGLVGMSSGSSGAPVRTRQNLAFLRYQEAHLDLVWREFELGQRAHVDIRTILPSLRAFELSLAAARLGHRIDRWFPAGTTARYGQYYTALTKAMVATVKLAGGDIPYPQPLASNDFLPVAVWIAAERKKGKFCVVTGFVSPSVRVAGAALDHGIDIRGTIFLGGGEAITAPKRAVIEAAGAQIYSRYHSTEIGDIGHGCRQMRTGNSVHLHRDSLAAIVHKRLEPLSGVDVDSLLLTTLLPSSPRILINVDMGDSGVLSQSRCDCAFSQAGLTTVIHEVASFDKLCGQGVTLVGTDVVMVLEQQLPALLGGRVGDFQLVEREANGQSEMLLYVSPRVGASAEAARQCFLQQLKRLFGGSLAVGLWTHAQGISVVIAEPIAGSTGKVLPLHLLGVRRDAAKAVCPGAKQK